MPNGKYCKKASLTHYIEMVKIGSLMQVKDLEGRP